MEGKNNKELILINRKQIYSRENQYIQILWKDEWNWNSLIILNKIKWKKPQIINISNPEEDITTDPTDN